MRTIRQFRKRAIDTLQNMLTRPGMFGVGWGLETLYDHVLWDLAYIDERWNDVEALLDDLKARGHFSCTGFVGRLEEALPNAGGCHYELASLFADIFSRFGWLTLDRRLSHDEWNKVEAFARTKRIRRDWRRDEIVDRFGEPSFKTLGRQYGVECYASIDSAAGWICFDYSNELRTWADKDGQHTAWVYEENPILRSIRRTSGHFWQSLRLTPIGLRMSAPLISKSKGAAACIRDTGILVSDIIRLMKRGRTEAEVLDDFPELTYADVDSTWDYYRRHTAEIERGLSGRS